MSNEENMDGKHYFEVIKLYVLLDRIGRVDDYIWDTIDYNKQKKLFIEIFDNLTEHLIDNEPLALDKILLRRDVLKGKITFKHREFGAGTGHVTECEVTDIDDENLLHRAIALLPTKHIDIQNGERKTSYEESRNDQLEEIIKHLIEKAPFLIKDDRKDNEKYDGQTPIHTAILKERKDIVNRMVEAGKTKFPKDMKTVFETKGKGSRFISTPMMAGSPICVAALTFNEKVFNCLRKKKCDVTQINDHGDNVMHSLIKYAWYNPRMLDRVLNMMDYIAKCQWLLDGKGRKEEDKKEQEKKILQLWMMHNRRGLNPLQLSAKLGIHEIFKRIMSYKVYCMKNYKDGLFDVDIYDITEIETHPEKEINPGTNTKSDKDAPSDRKAVATETQITFQYPILRDIMMQSNPKTAFAFIECPPVRAVINKKWETYRYMFFIWGLIHVIFMSCLTASAVERSRLRNSPFENTNETSHDEPIFVHSVASNGYLITMMVFSCLFGLLVVAGLSWMLCIHCFRRGNHGLRLKNMFGNPYSNSIYIVFLVILCVCLLVDVIAAYSSPLYENFLLTFSLIIGWYMVLLFLQGLRPLAFFTALVQKVIMDMLKFSVFMLVLLIAFSAAMFMIMQGADTDDESFTSMSRTLLKMFTIMLGIGDLDALFKARQPVMAVIVFVLFVLLTTILLLNALIAMMSNTCTELMSGYGKEFHFSLQKLSVVLLIESILPVRFIKVVGSVTRRNWFDKSKWYPKTNRLVWQKENVIDVETIESDDEDEIHQKIEETFVFNSLLKTLKPWMSSVGNNPTRSTSNGLASSRSFAEARERVSITRISGRYSNGGIVLEET